MSSSLRKGLVVDDEPIARRVVGRILVVLGCCPIEAADGRRALTILEDNTDIALMVTEMIMPVCDGRKFMLEMHSRGLTEKIPVIILSGLLSFSEVRDLIELGEVRFVPKPVDRDAVAQYVNSLMKIKQNLRSKENEHATSVCL